MTGITDTIRRLAEEVIEDPVKSLDTEARQSGNRRVEEIRERINRKLSEFHDDGGYHQEVRRFLEGAQALLMSPEAKRVRSVIPVLLAEENELSVDACLWYGVIIELLHFTSLVHDDVIDQHDVRRGLPTLNMQFSNTSAVLTGDYLIYEVINRCLSIAHSLKIISLVINAAKNMVAGVVIEQSALPTDTSLESYLEMARNKTGSLFALSFGLPFVADVKLQDALECGDLFGTVFQIYDDFLDRNSDKPHENIFNICTQEQIEEVLAEYTGRFMEIGRRINIESTLTFIMDFMRNHGYFNGIVNSE